MNVLVGLLLFFSMSFSGAQFSAFSPVSEEQSRASLVLGAETVRAGETVEVYVRLEHPAGWYSYYFNNSVSFTVRPTVKWEAVAGVRFSSLEYPVPEVKESFGIPSYVYTGVQYFRTSVVFSEDFKDDDEVVLKGLVEWQICKESCISESKEVRLSVVMGQAAEGERAPGLSELGYTREHMEGEATLTDAGLQYVLKGRVQPQSFYDMDGQTVFNRIRRVQYDGQETRVFLDLDEGNALRTERIKPLSRLRGFLLTESGTGWVDVPVQDMTSSSGVMEEADGAREQGAGVPGVAKRAEVSDGAAEGVEREGMGAAALELPADSELVTLYEAEKPIAYETLKKTAPVTFWIALGGAFLGGILLNLMPCVFPVLSLKILHFMEKAGEDAWKVRLHGMLFTLGVLLSMWVLAITLFSLKASTGQSINWGQQMGDARFVAGIIIILFLFGLNMAGVFELGTRLTSVGGRAESKNEYVATIFSGVLTTIVATPCSGPFLGAAMGYTLDQPLAVALVIFSVFALGISFPYLVLSFFPQLTAKMPRPGAWMETLKKVLSFGMFAAAAFFMKTFGAQVGAEGLAALVMALVLIGLATYFYGHWFRPHLGKAVRYGLGVGLGMVIFGTGVGMSWQAATAYVAPATVGGAKAGEVQWIEWRPGVVEHLRAEGYYVWVDYTASWCATCLVNKKRIFSDESFIAGLRFDEIVFVKADLTDNNPAIAQDLSRVQRAQIPVNLLYAPELEHSAVLLEELIPLSDAEKGLKKIGYYE